jgi:fucose permease
MNAEMDSDEGKSSMYVARVDRLPKQGLKLVIILALSFGYFIALYDVIDVGLALPYVSFNGVFLTSSQASFIASMGLLGYIPGAIGLSYLADRIGRKPALLLTATLTSIGSFGNAFAINYPMLVSFRFITGMGIGGDLILVMTYLVEMVPSLNRGHYVNMVYIAGWAGLGLGPLLASQIVLHIPVIGWRIIFVIGGTLAVIVLIIRAEMPESVRFLCVKRRFDKVETVVANMETVAMKRAKVNKLPDPKPVKFVYDNSNPFLVFKDKTYRKRILLVLITIFFFYWGEYPYLSLFTTYTKSILLYSTANQATVIALFGIAGVATFVGAIALRLVLEKVHRAKLVTFSNGAGMLLGVIIMIYGSIHINIPLMFGGMLLTNFIGVGWSNQLNYLNGSENVPSNARATAFSLQDGLGHLGAVISLLLLFPLVSVIGGLNAWIVYQVPMVIAAIVLIFVLPNAIGQKLETINEGKEGI